LIIAAATRMPTTTAMNAYSSLVFDERLVSVERRVVSVRVTGAARGTADV
jgi:hypothetical protein